MHARSIQAFMLLTISLVFLDGVSSFMLSLQRSFQRDLPSQAGQQTVMTTRISAGATRGEVIVTTAAGMLASVMGCSPATAAVPEALPACPADSNCVQQGRYMAPWYYGDDSADASAAYSKLLAAVENDPQLKVIEKDPEKLYIVALAKSAVPPDGFDKVEFLLKPEDSLVSFKSKSTKDAYAGPVLVGDGNSNRNRMVAFRKKLGWPEQGIDNYMAAQGIDSSSRRAKGYLSEFGWRQAETQSYGEEDEF